MPGPSMTGPVSYAGTGTPIICGTAGTNAGLQWMQPVPPHEPQPDMGALKMGWH